MIEVNNIYKSFDGKPVLKDVSAQFYTGKVNQIIGQSGSGKTVLMKCIIGLFRPEQGVVSYDGRILTKMRLSEVKMLRREVGMLFQGSALFDSLSVLENVMFPLRMFAKDMTVKQKEDRAAFCLNRVNLTSDKFNLFPGEISGGMQKRVAIARAIALNPKYLFCDEPNSGLDPVTSLVIDKLIEEITEEYNITTIVNTHDMNSVMEIGDKIGFIYNGAKLWEGNNRDILHSNCKELNDFVFATSMAQKLRGYLK